ncbi:MAG: thiamine diphosphokinase [Chloroflexi bacterium]|nr:thiamine diphosphokinase [Chloroflexota bacterium]
MQVIVFANGVLNWSERIRDLVRGAELIVAADGGARHALAAGFIPDVVIGDFDSSSELDRERYEQVGARLISFPSRKDETDLELALDYAVGAGAAEIWILAALGGRLDQLIANVLLLTLPRLRGVSVRIVDGDQEAFLIHDQACVTGCAADTVSLLPVGGDAIGVTASGLEWPLQDDTLSFGSTRGVSNVLVGVKASVSLRAGLLLCVVGHHG